jgi:pimeloyl-ACP methyl ester carboxylesterase
MLGISFSGGLSVVAAGRSAVRDRVSYVLSFGGHDDLPRVLRYLCTGSEPLPTDQLRLNGSQSAEVLTRPPHDYGVAVMLYGMAERVVPRAQVEGLRAAVQRYLLASALDTVDKSRAEIAFAELREASMKMPEPSRTLMRYVNDRDVVHLGPHLLPYVAQFGGDPALSPSRSPKPAAPVFLLHGTDDNVIPSVESEYLANDLRGHAPVRLLLSGLISHAEADRPAHIGDVLQLASFWGDLLSR